MARDLSLQLESLADGFTRSLRQGQQPDIEAVAHAHPELAERIRELFPLLEMIEARSGHSAPHHDMAAAADEPTAGPPTSWQLGDFRILREVGRGGMGIVYQAEQESLGRIVALKLLPDSSRFDLRRQQRFQQEARACALLHHTNIVPVFGIGRSENVSYFVMQFIEGTSLDQVIHELKSVRTGGKPLRDQSIEPTDCTLETSVSAAGRPLDPASAAQALPRSTSDGTGAPSRSRSSQWMSSSAESVAAGNRFYRNIAQVGWQVCDALAHAHSRKILHRDIKPANLLLEDSGHVWVTDFGLARLLDEDHLTRTGETVGTLRYLPPEQLQGRSDERSDLYSLGLTLYEMLTLQPAFEGRDQAEILARVKENRPVPPRKLDPHIPRDLETIVLKAMAPEPGRRYASAREMGADLKRFLDAEPILARRISPVMRLVKWTRRQPTVAALLTALLFSLTIGMAGVGWQWRKTAAALEMSNTHLGESQRQTALAKQHFQQARESVNRFFTVVSQQRLLNEPGLQALRRELLQNALDYHHQFVAQYRDDKELLYELGKSLYYVAYLEGEIRASPESYLACDEPIAIFRELAGNDRENADYSVWLARCLGLKSRYLRRHDLSQSLEVITLAIEVLEDVCGQHANDLDGLHNLSHLYQELGLMYESMGAANQETLRPLDYYSRALALRQQLQTVEPDNVDHFISAAELQRDLGITYRRSGEFELAEEQLEQALSKLEAIVQDYPERAAARRALASVAISVGFFHGSGNVEKDYDRALACYELAQQHYQFLADGNPLVIEYQDGVARAASNGGSIFQAQGRLEEALESRQRAAGIRQQLVAANPGIAHLISGYALTLNGVGATLRDLDRLADSRETHHQAHQHHLAAVEADPGQTTYRLRLIEGLLQLARTQAADLQFVDTQATIESVADYTLPEYSYPHFLMGVEYTVVACLIGRLDSAQRTPDLIALREELIEEARQSFSESARRGHDILRSWASSDVLRHFIQYPEASDMLEWVNAQFGRD